MLQLVQWIFCCILWLSEEFGADISESTVIVVDRLMANWIDLRRDKDKYLCVENESGLTIKFHWNLSSIGVDQQRLTAPIECSNHTAPLLKQKKNHELSSNMNLLVDKMQIFDYFLSSYNSHKSNIEKLSRENKNFMKTNCLENQTQLRISTKTKNRGREDSLKTKKHFETKNRQHSDPLQFQLNHFSNANLLIDEQKL